MLLYPSSACSLHGACSLPRFRTFPHPAELTDTNFARTPQQIHPWINFSLVFQLSLPTQCKTTAAGDNPTPRGAGPKDVH